jgi:pimeloyl-ACP methyl ester carboxylesterase
LYHHHDQITNERSALYRISPLAVLGFYLSGIYTHIHNAFSSHFVSYFSRKKKRCNSFLLGCLLPFFLERIIPCLPLAKNARLGLCNDYRLETSTYSFRTESVRQPTIVYLGEEDGVMPLSVSKHVHERLENAELRMVPNIGHLGLLRDGVLLDFFECLLNITSNHMEELRTEASSRDESKDSLEIC